MKYISFVLIIILLLSFASCADSRAGSELAGSTISGGVFGETDESDNNDQNTGDDPGQNAEDPGRVFDIRLTKAFKALCRDAAETADKYLMGIIKSKDTQKRLFEIIESMTEEYERLPEGDSANAGAGAIMMTMSLHDTVKDSPGDIEKIVTLRDILEKYSKYR